ncbi:NO-inducible flavohemoprotein [Leucothrix arctica]|uniref:nitric oxide dioxygenase n=1 Tax=Leucothrix arctica TaxID=1481894 RepID=A0A317CLV8_9GAMM|nr:NO-inducible flavohemoprotein [Leucothrix arctica]PWQ99575.1 NO-inducible flavohemoprotein [Leucothrix arctica]
MLSAQTIETIKSTVPLLEEHGATITSTFYKSLFEAEPDLKHIFNASNQRDDSQSRALADAVLAYACNIDNLAALLPAVERIANKHASIGILPQHYPIVGGCLLQAIQSVLGLPDKHPALTAWGEAYGVLASVFTQAEEQLYTDSEQLKGGWRGFRTFTIKEIHQETPEVSSFVLVPTDEKEILEFLGGQYVSIKLPAVAGGFNQIRQYSLSDWSSEPNHYRLSVKSESQGIVSKDLHAHKQGDTVQLSAPYGRFNLVEDAPEHVFIAGGVGITPLFSMLQQSLANATDKSPLTLIECSRSKEHQIFQPEIQALIASEAINFKQAFQTGDGGDHSGYITAEILNNWITNKSAHVYFCGPLPFMKALKPLLNEIGFTDEQLHYEVFGPTTAL